MVDSILNFFLGGASIAAPSKVVDRISNVKLDHEECVLRLEYLEGILLASFNFTNGFV
jgi:hypothetical protein